MPESRSRTSGQVNHVFSLQTDFFLFSIASPFEKGKVITEPAVVSIRLLSVDSTLS